MLRSSPTIAAPRPAGAAFSRAALRPRAAPRASTATAAAEGATVTEPVNLPQQQPQLNWLRNWWPVAFVKGALGCHRRNAQHL